MMAGIDANLDDLQSGVEAFTRAAHAIELDAAAVDQKISKNGERANLIGRFVKQAKELQTCAHDQSGALQELRQNVDLLRAELKLSNNLQRRSGAVDRRRANRKDVDRVSSPSQE
jgi:hypothetical protein